jgi:molybdate transport system ATP-binding protein
MVKNPRLLILDEPCQGLDPANRRSVLDAVDAACAAGDTSLLYVTHHDDEHPRCLDKALILARAGGPAEIVEFPYTHE